MSIKIYLLYNIIFLLAITACTSKENLQNTDEDLFKSIEKISDESPVKLPIKINTNNYLQYTDELSSSKPLVVRAVILKVENYDKEIEKISGISDAAIVKELGFGSYKDLQSKLSIPGQAEYLQSIGISKVSYNSEGQHTPKSEMDYIRNTDPEQNSVAKFASIAASHGFKPIWAPLRNTADKTKDEALRAMYQAGLEGIALQEQRFIETSCAQARVDAIRNTIERHKKIAGKNIEVQVQIMPSRCERSDDYAVNNCGLSPNHEKWENCGQLIKMISQDIDVLSIWATSPADSADLVEFINYLRNISVNSNILNVTEKSKEYNNLKIGMRIYDPNFVNSIAKSEDIYGVGYKKGFHYANNILSQIPTENRMLMTPSVEKLTDILDNITVDISYIGYDLERWPETPISEQEDPVNAVKLAQEIAHSRGLKLVIGPSRYFNEKYGEELAPYADIYMPQAKFYQAHLSDDEYEMELRQLYNRLIKTNPNLIIFLDISPSPKNIEKTPEEMIQSVESVRDLVDGVWITYSPNESELVREFVMILRN